MVVALGLDEAIEELLRGPGRRGEEAVPPRRLSKSVGLQQLLLLLQAAQAGA